MHGTLPPRRGVNHTSAWVGLPNGLGEAPLCGAYSHAYMVIIILGGEFDIATAPGLSRRLEPLAKTGRPHACSPTAARPQREPRCGRLVHGFAGRRDSCGGAVTFSVSRAAMADAWVPVLIVRVAVRPRRGRRSLAGCTPRGGFSGAAEGARAIVGFCFEVFEPGEYDG